jgi:hypothetical protein
MNIAFSIQESIFISEMGENELYVRVLLGEALSVLAA